MKEDRVPSWIDEPEVLSVVFHPRREAHWTAGGGFEELTIPVAEDVSVGARFYDVGKDRPTILFFHGNGEIVADYADIASLYTSIRINFLPVDYRGYGRSTGVPTITSMLEDARTVFAFARDWLRSRDYTGPLVVMGRSLGSASALEIAAAFPADVDGLIIESGFADTMVLLVRLGAPILDRAAESDVLGQTAKIARYGGPVLIIHGSADWIIPVEDARLLMDASTTTSKRLLIVEGAGHNDLLSLGMKEYVGAIAELVAGAERGGSA